jgi:V/A-type H+/Na+-transporting ATPase subunit G/H
MSRQLNFGGRMVDESLKRLLDAEAKAEDIIARADQERQAIIEQAQYDVQTSERQLAERVKDIHASFLAQAEQRAQQSVAEMKRRHAERAKALRASAATQEHRALDAAIRILTETDAAKP